MSRDAMLERQQLEQRALEARRRVALRLDALEQRAEQLVLRARGTARCAAAFALGLTIAMTLAAFRRLDPQNARDVLQPRPFVSHSLVRSLGWTLSGLAFAWLYRRRRAPLLPSPATAPARRLHVRP